MCLRQCHVAPEPPSLSGGSSTAPMEGGCSLFAWLHPSGCCMGAPVLCRQQAKFGITFVLSCSQTFSPSLTPLNKLQSLPEISGSQWAGKRGTELCSLEQTLSFPFYLKPELTGWVGRLGMAHGTEQPLALPPHSPGTPAPQPALPPGPVMSAIIKSSSFADLSWCLAARHSCWVLVYEVLSCSRFHPRFKDANRSALPFHASFPTL